MSLIKKRKKSTKSLVDEEFNYSLIFRFLKAGGSGIIAVIIDVERI